MSVNDCKGRTMTIEPTVNKRVKELKDIHCIGCHSYHGWPSDKTCCVAVPMINHKRCPCLTCLIKMMCKYACELLSNYQGVLNQAKSGQIRN